MPKCHLVLRGLDADFDPVIGVNGARLVSWVFSEDKLPDADIESTASHPGRLLGNTAIELGRGASWSSSWARDVEGDLI